MTDKEVQSFADTISKFSLSIEESARCIKILSKPKHPFMKSSPKIYGQLLHKRLRINYIRTCFIKILSRMSEVKQHGGVRKGAGRKPRAEEIQLYDKLDPMKDDAFKAISEGIKNGDFRFVKLFMEYYAGKPTEHKEISLDNELAQVMINLGNGTK